MTSNSCDHVSNNTGSGFLIIVVLYILLAIILGSCLFYQKEVTLMLSFFKKFKKKVAKCKEVWHTITCQFNLFVKA